MSDHLVGQRVSVEFSDPSPKTSTTWYNGTVVQKLSATQSKYGKVAWILLCDNGEQEEIEFEGEQKIDPNCWKFLPEAEDID